MKKRAKVEGQVWQAGKTNVFCEWRSGVARWKMELLEHKPWYFSGNRKQKQENRNWKTEKVEKRGLQDGRWSC